MDNWIGTNSGKRISLSQPSIEDICIEDIATGLANTCRFGGQIGRWYSVAEHAIKVASMVPDHLKMQALLHDATEAYICDIPTPLKWELGDAYAQIENRLALAIGHRFRLGDSLANLHPTIKIADRAVLMAERDNLQSSPQRWNDEFEQSIRMPGFAHQHLHADSARDAFMLAYNRYLSMERP